MDKDAVCLLTHFVQRIQHRNSINIQLDKARAENARKNREALGPIVESVIFLGRHNLPFRGHRNDSKFHAEDGEQTSGQVGIFQCLIILEIFKEHLRTSSRNAKYTSAPIQNEIIDACGEVITQKLAMRIKESGFFSVIADETTDISNKQQLALVIRYSSNDIREDFMKFIHCEDGVAGENIKNYILEAHREVGIDVSLPKARI